MDETTIKLDKDQTKERLSEIKRSLTIMEWDIKMNQINPAMRQKYEDLKKEYESLQSTILE